MSAPSRRGVLKAGLGLPALGLAGSALARAASAAAGPGGDYRALVLVFVQGGMDGHDLLIPADKGGFRDWARGREAIVRQFEQAKAPRTLDTVLRVGGDGDGQALALPPDMPRTAAAVGAGQAALVANVGPMVGPVTPAEMAAGRAALPPQLFNHANQAEYWQHLAPAEAALTGWGGRIAEAARGRANAFSTVGTDTGYGFLSGRDGAPVTVSDVRAHTMTGMKGTPWGDDVLGDLVREHLTSAPGGGILERDVARLNARTLDVAEELKALFGSTDAGEEVTTKRHRLAHDLSVIAKMIALRAETGARRQVFYAEMRGFDTHADQGRRMGPLQRELDEGLHRFTRWLGAQGLSDAVTVFTATEFGRTFVPNETGTDHGWGSHSIVWGGAVNGGRVFGSVPPPATGHAHDAGRGRLIPGLSVEQLGVPLARWLGVPDADMDHVFPYAGRFDTDAIPLMRA